MSDSREVQGTLIGLVGLPYSGKSTKAKTLGAPIVCPDAIRLAMHGQRFAPEAEGMVWSIAKIMVRALFLAGHTHVVLDACNTTEKRRAEWEKGEWNVSWLVVRASFEACRERALEVEDTEILDSIHRMAEAWDVPEAW